MRTQILVIGGGASGMTAAISAKTARPDADVTLLEALPRCGKKLLATGNGRCNLINRNTSPESYPSGGAFASEALEKFDPARFFESLGIDTVFDGEGRGYPASFQASGVLDALRLALGERGVKLVCDCPVKSIAPRSGGFAVIVPEGEYSARRVILASGGSAGKGLGENASFRMLEKLGHHVNTPLPALTHLVCGKKYVAGLKGIRLKGRFTLLSGDTPVACEEGEAIFRDDGISGIAIMQLSLGAKQRLLMGEKLVLRLCPGALRPLDELKARLARFSRRALSDVFTGELNRFIAQNAIRRAQLSPDTPACELSEKDILRLHAALNAWDIPVTDTGSFADAQVMEGGLSTDEFRPETLESRLCPGLYACGEALDVTGYCGGHNLTWAWASGSLAGREAADSL
ncbi:MAG: aminoacetone oxidase family FAD-binding enzyme [Clostridiales bacterium]|nr:aminoacetone oxidase family FAD-binding enzyme [Clostridiales bacterium]